MKMNKRFNFANFGAKPAASEEATAEDPDEDTAEEEAAEAAEEGTASDADAATAEDPDEEEGDEVAAARAAAGPAHAATLIAHGAAQATARAAAIFQLPEAATNPQGAAELAFNSGLDAETAQAVLKTVGTPPATTTSAPETGASMFAAAVKTHGAVNPGPGGMTPSATAKDAGARLIADATSRAEAAAPK